MTALLFLVCFFAGLGLAIARHPIYGLLTYVGAYYLHPPSRWWGAALPDLRWSLLAALITMIAILIHKSKLMPLAARSGRTSLIVGYALFAIWLLIQSSWAMEADMQSEMLTLFVKYALLIWLMTTAIDSEKHLQWFCWAHVLGCFYLGWVAFDEYHGGRFEYFGGPDINEANSGALQLVSGIFTAAALFLLPEMRNKIALLLTMPLVVNGMILTSSRSAFLAAASGGLIYNLFTHARFKRLVRFFTILAALAFLALTPPQYWQRISSITAAGAEVEGVDTGSGRLVLMQAQLQMFASHPLGCGHRCTVTLSPQYLDESHLTGTAEQKGRASHNTFMSLMVEQGIPGMTFYALFLIWVARKGLQLHQLTRNTEGFLSTLTPSILAFMTALVVGDIFVDYLKSEVRVWFASLLVVAVSLAIRARETRDKAAEAAGSPENPPPVLTSASKFRIPQRRPLNRGRL